MSHAWNVQIVVERSRLKSSALAVKAVGLQRIPLLEKELAKKDDLITSALDDEAE